MDELKHLSGNQALDCPSGHTQPFPDPNDGSRERAGLHGSIDRGARLAEQKGSFLDTDKWTRCCSSGKAIHGILLDGGHGYTTRASIFRRHVTPNVTLPTTTCLATPTSNVTLIERTSPSCMGHGWRRS